jgi:hypothetical protein
MVKIIRYEVGSDYKPGERLPGGDEVDLPLWGIDAIYDGDPERANQVTGLHRHTGAITVCTSDEDRRICLEALNKRLGLDIVGRAQN